jgi:lysozyme
MRDLLINHLIVDEGLKLKPYHDTMGKLTIGIGRNLDDVGITKDEAMLLLEHDVDSAIKDCLALFSNFNQLTERRRAVLANMMFNLGKNRLAAFKNMRVRIAAGDYAGASKEMLNSLWAKQVGDRAVRLADMMRNG